MARERVLVTGSAGHLGEALIRVLHDEGREVVGVDILDSPLTTVVGSIADRDVVRGCITGVSAVLHAATLHKPHVDSHDRQAFVDTNITGTLALLEESAAAGVESFVFTSTTSAFGRALTPARGGPAAWITEDVTPVPRNIYGATKTAAEDLCELVHLDRGLHVVVRRVDVQDVVEAHLLAADHAPRLGFAKYIVSATTPFTPDDLAELRINAPGVVRRLFPDQHAEYERRDWTMFPQLDRVYVNARARAELGWTPYYDFRRVLDRLKADDDPRSPLARAVGAKGYHAVSTGSYTVR